MQLFNFSRMTKVIVRHIQEVVEKVFRSIYIHCQDEFESGCSIKKSLNELPWFNVTWQKLL